MKFTLQFKCKTQMEAATRSDLSGNTYRKHFAKYCIQLGKAGSPLRKIIGSGDDKNWPVFYPDHLTLERFLEATNQEPLEPPVKHEIINF